MKKIWVVLCLLVVLSMIPSVAFASVPTYYCAYNAVEPTYGTYDHPWLCVDNTTYQQVVSDICAQHDPFSILYQIVADGYYRRTFEINSAGACVETSQVFYHGYPPNTGVRLPAPLLIGGALGLGLALVLGGVVIYRKRSA